MADDESANPEESESRAPPSGTSKRYLAVGVALVGVLGFCWLGLVSSGTRVIEDPTDVESADHASRCQLVAASEVRCTAVFAAEEAAVWTAVTDYDSFNETFQSGWGSLHVTAVPGESGDVRLDGHLEGTFGTWPVEVTIHHSDTDSGHRATWDESGDRVTTNRGSWELQADGDETKVIYALEVVVDGAWRPMVNVALQLVGANVVEELRRAVDG